MQYNSLKNYCTANIGLNICSTFSKDKKQSLTSNLL